MQRTLPNTQSLSHTHRKRYTLRSSLQSRSRLEVDMFSWMSPWRSLRTSPALCKTSWYAREFPLMHLQIHFHRTTNLSAKRLWPHSNARAHKLHEIWSNTPLRLFAMTSRCLSSTIVLYFLLYVLSSWFGWSRWATRNTKYDLRLYLIWFDLIEFDLSCRCVSKTIVPYILFYVSYLLFYVLPAWRKWA